MTKITRSFYQNKDTLFVARNLIGKVLCTNIDGQLTSGIISETEAYLGESDAASHAYKGKHTKRTSSMFNDGGFTYVYLCYGIHRLFNVVSGPKDYPHAILIRNMIPQIGIETMLLRRGKEKKSQISIGPGTLSSALGIQLTHDKIDLLGETIWIEEGLLHERSLNIISTPRIGVDYAGDDAKLPYRFILETNF